MKILIGAVLNSKQKYVLNAWADAVKKQEADVLCIVSEQAYGTLVKSLGLPILQVMQEKSFSDQVLQGRKVLRKHALQNGYDALLLVNGDVIIPEHARKALERTEGDIRGGVYLNAFEMEGKTVLAPVVFKDMGKGEAQLYTYEGVAIPQLIEAGAMGLGCALISKKVLETFDFMTYGTKAGSEDMRFCVDARAKGFKCVVNTGVKCLQAPYPLDDPRAVQYAWNKRVEDFTVDMKY